MEKTFTLTFCAALSLSLYAQAQSVKPVPRPVAPGLEFKADNANRAKPSFDFKKQNKATRPSVSIATAPRAPRAEAMPEVQVDTLLATAKMDILTGAVERTRAEVTYDEYGRRKTYSEFNSEGVLERKLTYEYTTGAHNFWTKKVVKEEADGVTQIIEQEEREINENGWITLRKIYESDNNGGVFLAMKSVYDYAHQVIDSDTELPTRGFMVEHEQFYYDAETNQIKQQALWKYQWFAPAGKYLMSFQQDKGVTTYETTFGEDYATATSYSFKSDNTTYKQRETTTWYAGGESLGYKDISYNEDGSVSFANGSRTVIEKNSPSAGWTTELHQTYSQEANDFLPYYKTEYKGKKPANGKFFGNYEEHTYSYSDGKYTESDWEKYEAQGGNIYKETWIFNPQGEYFKYDAEGNVIGEVTFNDDKSYVVEEEGDNYQEDILYYYTAKHELEKTIKRVAGYQSNVEDPEGSYVGSDNEEFTFYILKDSNWELLTEYETSESAGNYKSRTVYKFTKEGYPESVTTYTSSSSINGGKEFIDEQDVYTYQDNGYTLVKYSGYTAGGKPIKDSEHSYILQADGTYVQTNLFYYGEKEPESGGRTEKKDGVTKSYTYNSSTKQFDLQSVNAGSYTTTAEDGTQTTISQRWDETAQKAVPDRKTVRLSKHNDNDTYSEDLYEEYTWDEATSKWVGQSKRHTKKETVEGFSFDNSFNQNPIENYSDEYSAAQAAEIVPFVLEKELTYTWDEAKGDWGTNPEGKDYSYTLSGNTLSVKHSQNDGYGQSSTFDETYTAEGGKLISKQTVETQNYSEGNSNTFNYKTEYSYNKYGVLQEVKNYEGGELEHGTKYVFTEATIKPMLPPVSGITGANADAAKVTVNGRTVTAPDGGKVTLYAPDGRIVATGNGSATAPAAGIFIAKVGSKAAKIAVE